MDNGSYFIGDLIHPRHFSRIVRLCLYFGVEPVFTAPRKPWMNGSIENFNGDFEKIFWTKGEFENLTHMRQESNVFEKRHNNSQEWKKRKIKLVKIPIRKILKDFKTDTHKFPITKGKVHFIRQVKKDGKISILNENFEVDISLAHEYVWTTIDTGKEQMMIYHREKKAVEVRLVKLYEYNINEEVKVFNLDF